MRYLFLLAWAAPKISQKETRAQTDCQRGGKRCGGWTWMLLQRWGWWTRTSAMLENPSHLLIWNSYSHKEQDGRRHVLLSVPSIKNLYIYHSLFPRVVIILLHIYYTSMHMLLFWRTRSQTGSRVKLFLWCSPTNVRFDQCPDGMLTILSVRPTSITELRDRDCRWKAAEGIWKEFPLTPDAQVRGFPQGGQVFPAVI